MPFLLHQLLTESAQRFPDREAARFEGRSMTYAQLDQLSNQMAGVLQESGVQKGDRVGIYVHKSFASLVSVFSVMKAGGTYVPLDPNAPAMRLAYITRNCEIKVLLTATNKLHQVSEIINEGSPFNIVVLTDDDNNESSATIGNVDLIPWSHVLGKPLEFEPVGRIETDLAYILYTSGSTGEPKGVMISHRTIFTFINWCFKTFSLTPDDRVTSHAPLHFDLSTFDIFVTIKAGATIVLLPEKASIFPVKLVKLLRDERVTITYLVPSILALMVNYGKLTDHDLSNLRLVLFAGEVFPIKYLRKLVEAIPGPEYFNLYGPTETNVCTYYKVKPSDLSSDKTQPVPIGMACENIEVFVVGEDDELISEPGKQGELWVKGSCVAQGYWGDMEKTNQNFVLNPYQTQFNEIVYRTGDLVTLHDDGKNWVYVGRKDHMIKSRGYRIELGDIETAFYSHKGVKEVAVLAIPDDLVGNRILAFVVPMDSDNLSKKEIESHVANKLPRYMIPESIEFIGELPKTSTGKINRPLLAKQRN